MQSCRKNYDEELNNMYDPQAMSTYSQTQYRDGEATVLGAQYTIPFKVSEMRRAKDSLTAKQITNPNSFVVRTTHLYVKFSPTTMQQLDILENDSTLEITSVPKDYLINVQGSWYKAPNLPDSVPSPQYASVKLGYTFPAGVSYQVLDSLYVPDEDVQLLGSNPTQASLYYADRLIHEAYTININPSVHHITRMPDWDDYEDGGVYTPPAVHGTIRVFDNRLDRLVPLEGVKVESRKHGWGTAYRYGYTNANGEYSLTGTQTGGNSNYKIEFWRNGFAIADHSLNYAKIERNNMDRMSFSHNIDLGYENMEAHMFRAAYRHFHGNIGGLKRYTPGIFRKKIVAVNGTRWWGAGINPIILPLYVARFWDDDGTDVEYRADDIFSTTIHELTHSTHCQLMGWSTFIGVSTNIRESWALGVEWMVTRMEYTERGIPNYGNETYNPANPPQFPNHYGFQFWNGTDDPHYTSLFINLVDDFNEFGVNLRTPSNPLMGTVNDEVSGYTLKNIEVYLLSDIYGMSSLGTELKSMRPTGVTNAQIDLLLSHY